MEGGLPKFLPQAQTRADVQAKVEKLVKTLTLSEDQMDRIVGFPSYRWAQDSVQRIIEDIARLAQEIESLQQLLADPRKIRDNYKKEVASLLKSVSRVKQ